MTTELPVIVPDWLDAPAGVGALATTRRGGISTEPYDDGHGGGGLNLGMHCGDNPEAVRQNRERLQALLPGVPRWTSQVHGIAVADAATVEPGGPVQVADAAVTDVRGVVCAVMTADCLPVLFADTAGKVVGAAHAGWRGLAGGVLAATIAAMRARGAGEITAWLGPAIGPQQFEVGADVLDSFVARACDAAEAEQVREAFVPYVRREGKYVADMYALARLFLARDGVTRVSGGTHCTFTERSTFYSYRRDKITGRQASLIWLK